VFDFERLFPCRQLQVTETGVAAEGIGFRHPAELKRLLFFAHVLTPSVSRPFRYSLSIETIVALEPAVVGNWQYTLLPTSRPDRRVLLAYVPVHGLLAPGKYEAIITVEDVLGTRTGFEIE
jgi:hypothetical protein